MKNSTQYTGNDIYCDLIIPRKILIEVVAETNQLLAYYHTKPHWPTHIVVTPKVHVDSLLELEPELATEMLDLVKEVSSGVLKQKGACAVLTNLGDYQDSKHLHIHITSGGELTK
jgi:histidine triad (HIT) family protein